MSARITIPETNCGWFAARTGNVMPIFAMSLMAIFSLVGAAIALSVDSSAANKLQMTADSAALGGATAFITAPTPRAEDRLAIAQTQATALATANSDYVLTDLVVAALTEDAYGQRTRIAVEMEYDPVNIMAKFAGRNANIAIRREAAAEATWGFPLCVLTLAESGSGLNVSGNASLLAQNCIIWSNSDDQQSMTFRGGDSEAKYFCTAGNARVSGGAHVAPRPQEGCEILPDPMADWRAPSPGTCDETELVVTTDKRISLSPGTYCDGLRVTAKDATFEPGIYHITDGDLRLQSSGDIVAEGVTFILSGDSAELTMRGSGRFTLIAPETGETAGIAIAEIVDPNGPARTWYQSSLSGNGTLDIEGLIYLPTHDFHVLGSGGGEQSSPNLQIVSRTLSLSGAGSLDIDFNEDESAVPVVIQPERTARLVY